MAFGVLILVLPLALAMVFGTATKKRVLGHSSQLMWPPPAVKASEPGVSATKTIDLAEAGQPWNPAKNAAILAKSSPAEAEILAKGNRRQVGVESHVTRLDATHWRVDLRIYNHGPEVAEGRVFTVASLQLPNGDVVRVSGKERSFKAERMTLKHEILMVPAKGLSAELVGLEVMVASAKTGEVEIHPALAH